jgi:hypothetical protein
MSTEHTCTQAQTINSLIMQTERQNRALFGNPNDEKDLGAIELIKEIHKTQLEMIPTYKGLKDWKTFWDIGKQLGGILVAILVGTGVIFGAVLAIKSWIKN